MNVTPCKNCQDRTLGCHDKCEKYIEWKAERQKILDKKNEILETETALRGTYTKGYKKLAGVHCHKK